MILLLHIPLSLMIYLLDIYNNVVIKIFIVINVLCIGIYLYVINKISERKIFNLEKSLNNFIDINNNKILTIRNTIIQIMELFSSNDSDESYLTNNYDDLNVNDEIDFDYKNESNKKSSIKLNNSNYNSLNRELNDELNEKLKNQKDSPTKSIRGDLLSKLSSLKGSSNISDSGFIKNLTNAIVSDKVNENENDIYHVNPDIENDIDANYFNKKKFIFYINNIVNFNENTIFGYHVSLEVDGCKIIDADVSKDSLYSEKMLLKGIRFINKMKNSDILSVVIDVNALDMINLNSKIYKIIEFESFNTKNIILNFINTKSIKDVDFKKYTKRLNSINVRSCLKINNINLVNQIIETSNFNTFDFFYISANLISTEDNKVLKLIKNIIHNINKQVIVYNVTNAYEKVLLNRLSVEYIEGDIVDNKMRLNV